MRNEITVSLNSESNTVTSEKGLGRLGQERPATSEVVLPPAWRVLQLSIMFTRAGPFRCPHRSNKLVPGLSPWPTPNDSLSKVELLPAMNGSSETQLSVWMNKKLYTLMD